MELEQATDYKLSQMAEKLVGSEIIKLAGEVKKLQAEGEDIKNLTIGDFNPGIFPIPNELKQGIIKAYQDNHTNYPAANGIEPLRNSISSYLKHYGKLDYTADEILVAGGARPMIYACYQAIVDAGDDVIFPVPSWNNNHYTHLSHGNPIFIEARAENKFMPTAEDIKPHISSASLIAICSPLNPTGTTISRENLEAICDLVLEENKRRGPSSKPVYLLFDQIYWMLTMEGTKHYDPVSLRPEMRDFTLFIDGMSKAFASTGVRVGWAFGPQKLINKMKAILGHIGAWSPKAEQVASAEYLADTAAIDTYIATIRKDIQARLDGFHTAFQALKSEGLPVDSIAPEAAMYLTVSIDVMGKQTESGVTLETMEDVAKYLINEAKVALVPFYAFGADRNSAWFRLSIGTTEIKDIETVKSGIKNALTRLS